MYVCSRYSLCFKPTEVVGSPLNAIGAAVVPDGPVLLTSDLGRFGADTSDGTLVFNMSNNSPCE